MSQKELVKELEKELEKEPIKVLKQKSPGRVEAGKRLQSFMKERRENAVFKPNKYYVGAGVLLLLTIIYYIDKKQPAQQKPEVPVTTNQFDFDI